MSTESRRKFLKMGSVVGTSSLVIGCSGRNSIAGVGPSEINESWPRRGFDMRGVNFNDVKTNIGNMSINWEYDYGNYLSDYRCSPALAGETVYVTGASKSGRETAGSTNLDIHVDAVDGISGEKKWRTTIGSVTNSRDATSPKPVDSLVVKEGRIFVQSPKALICLSLSGDILWKFSNVTSRESPASVASHPLVFDGKVYTTTYGYKYSPEAKVPPVSLFCLDAESGLVNWKYTDERYSPDESKNNKNYYLYPITFRPASANGTVYAVIEHRGVVAIDASSGELMWRVDGQAMTPPMVYNSNVYTTVISDSGSSYNSSETDVVQIVALDAQTGSLQWTHRISRHAVKLLAKNDHIFLYSDNVFFKLTARDGLLKWAMNHGELAGLSVQPSSLVASNNQIILNSYKSIARVDPKSGTLTTTQQLPTRSSSMSASLAFGGNVVFGTLPNQTLFSVS